MKVLLHVITGAKKIQGAGGRLVRIPHGGSHGRQYKRFVYVHHLPPFIHESYCEGRAVEVSEDTLADPPTYAVPHYVEPLLL